MLLVAGLDGQRKQRTELPRGTVGAGAMHDMLKRRSAFARELEDAASARRTTALCAVSYTALIQGGAEAGLLAEPLHNRIRRSEDAS